MTLGDLQEKAVQFLVEYFKGCKGYSYLWLNGKQSDYKRILPFNVEDEKEISAQVQKAFDFNFFRINPGVDELCEVYFGVNISSTPCYKITRPEIDDITVQTAIIADIDIRNAAHHKRIKKAISFLPNQPSLIISSGDGIQAYYQFATPLALNTAEERKLAVNRGKSFLDVIRRNAGTYKIDGVQDLTRILRLPYTWDEDNLKMCTIVEQNDLLFTPAQIDEIISANIEKPSKQNFSQLPDDSKTVAPVINNPYVFAPISDETNIATLTQEIKYCLDLTEKFQALATRGVIETGKRLTLAKKQLKHGEWKKYLDKEFQLTIRTAQYYIAVAERFGEMVCKNEINFVFQPTQLISMLALPAGEEEKFIAEMTARNTPVEGMTIRELKSAIKEWKSSVDAAQIGETIDVTDNSQIVSDFAPEDGIVKLVMAGKQMINNKATLNKYEVNLIDMIKKFLITLNQVVTINNVIIDNKATLNKYEVESLEGIADQLLTNMEKEISKRIEEIMEC